MRRRGSGSDIGVPWPRGFKLGAVGRLPGTAVEAASITRRLEQYAGTEPRVWTDKQALAVVFKAAKNPRMVVLSTHGFFLEEEGRAPGRRPGRAGRGRPETVRVGGRKPALAVRPT